MNTQLKEGDRVTLTGKWASDNIGICTLIEIDDTEPKYCVAVDCSQNYWVNSDSIVKITPIPPTPKWLPIDKDNIYPDKVVVMNITQPTHIFTGTLELNRYDDITLYIGNGQYLSNFTHYISLTDLVNLSIAE